MARKFRLLAFLIAFLPFGNLEAQIYPIPGGQVIPGNGVTCFSFNVSGVGTLYPAGMFPWTPFFDHLLINSIITTHPQTLVITLVSPGGTSLILSAYNGAGGSNYINTNFTP